MTDSDRHAEAIASLAQRHAFRVGVAESLTCGKLATGLGAAPSASEWFRGGVVAYASEVKFEVLGVTPGPVVTAECAREMAVGTARLLGADAVAAVTGVGGPDPEEGKPPGTVHVATYVRGVETGADLQLAGDPEEVLRQTQVRALEILHAAMQSALDPAGPAPARGQESNAL